MDSPMTTLTDEKDSVYIKEELDIDVKEELEIGEQQITEEVWKFERSSTSEPSVKCGEVIFENRQKFILICSLCKEQYEDMNLFGSHILNLHFKYKSDSESEDFGSLFVVEETLHSLDNGSKEIHTLSNIHTEDVEVKDDSSSENDTTSTPLDGGHSEMDSACCANQTGQQQEVRHEVVAEGVEQRRLEFCNDVTSNCFVNQTVEKQQDVRYEMITEEVDQRHKEPCNENAPMKRVITSTVVGGKKVVACPICDFKYVIKKCLISHALKQHGIVISTTVKKVQSDDQPCKSIPAVEFNAATDGSRMLTNNISNNSPMRTHVNVNGSDATNRSSAESEEDHNESYSAVQSNDSQMDDVQPLKTNARQLICPLCHKGFRLYRDLKAHIKMTHQGITTPNQILYFPCPLYDCNRTFRTRASCRTHVMALHPYMISKLSTLKFNPRFKCAVCGRIFLSAVALGCHMKDHKVYTIVRPCDCTKEE